MWPKFLPRNCQRVSMPFDHWPSCFLTCDLWPLELDSYSLWKCFIEVMCLVHYPSPLLCSWFKKLTHKTKTFFKTTKGPNPWDIEKCGKVRSYIYESGYERQNFFFLISLFMHFSKQNKNKTSSQWASVLTLTSLAAILSQWEEVVLAAGILT